VVLLRCRAPRRAADIGGLIARTPIRRSSSSRVGASST
jgi:hypothetical protein